MEILNAPDPENKPTLVNRMVELVKEKKNQIVEAYGQTDWNTKKELLKAHGVFIVGMTLAGGFGMLSKIPAAEEAAWLFKFGSAVLASGATASEVGLMVRLWAIDQHQKLEAVKA